jgi:hypothetical protein
LRADFRADQPAVEGGMARPQAHVSDYSAVPGAPQRHQN